MNINKKIKLLDFKLTKTLGWSLFWAYKSKFYWTWMEFAEHREYTFWDSVKNIDWKVSARTTDMQIKKYEEERDLNVLFLIDISQTMMFWSEEKTKLDILEEIFYSLSFSALQNNDNIWAFIYDEKIIDFVPYKRSVWNIFKILEIIDKNKEKTTFKKNTMNVLNEINKQKIRNSLIFILTDDTNLENENILRLSWSKNEVIFINIFDYFENNLTNFNNDFSFNFENEFLNIFLKKEEKIEKYRLLREKNITALKYYLQKNQIRYLMIDTKKNLYKELIWFFNTINT